MFRKFDGRFRPTAYQFGKRGAIVAGSYLALVCGVAIFVLVTELLSPPDDANLAGVWLFLVTAPTAFLSLLAPESGWGVYIGTFLLAGLFQAYLVWLALRGRPVERDGLHPSNS